MRSLLRELRKTEIINRLGRFLLNDVYKHFDMIFREAQKRWPPSGIVNCEFNGINFKMYSHCDDDLVYFFYYNKKYNEHSDLNLFSILAKHSKCILDIGANTGLFSIISREVNPRSTIYAFEPYDANIDRIKKNLLCNGIADVKVIAEALGDKVGMIDIFVPANNEITSVASIDREFSRRFQPESDWTTRMVVLNTLDNFRTTLDTPVDLIKCDVETYEMSVFRGAKETFNVDRPTIIFESFVDLSRKEFFNKFISDHDYYLYLILEEGIFYCKDGFPDRNFGMNFLMTPIKPDREFIGYSQIDLLLKNLLVRYSSL